MLKRIIYIFITIFLFRLSAFAQDGSVFTQDRSITLPPTPPVNSEWTVLGEPTKSVDTIGAPGVDTILPPHLIEKDSEAVDPIQKNNKDDEYSVDSRAEDKKRANFRIKSR